MNTTRHITSTKLISSYSYSDTTTFSNAFNASNKTQMQFIAEHPFSNTKHCIQAWDKVFKKYRIQSVRRMNTSLYLLRSSRRLYRALTISLSWASVLANVCSSRDVKSAQSVSHSLIRLSVMFAAPSVRSFASKAYLRSKGNSNVHRISEPSAKTHASLISASFTNVQKTITAMNLSSSGR